MAPISRPLATAVTVALGVALLAGCGDDGDKKTTGTPKVCSTASPADESLLEELPPGLSLDQWGTVMKVSTRRGFVGAQAITETSIVELYPELSRRVRSEGYQQISGENEGFEAEIYFQKGRDTGAFLLREGPCEGQVTVRLIYGSAQQGASR